MPQLFWSVFTTMLLHFLFQFLYEYHVDFSTLPHMSEHLRLTDREIIFEEFQPMSSKSFNVNHIEIDRRTDDIARPRFALYNVIAR